MTQPLGHGIFAGTLFRECHRSTGVNDVICRLFLADWLREIGQVVMVSDRVVIDAVYGMK